MVGKEVNNISEIERILAGDSFNVAMVAPSFLTDFKYPGIISRLRELGFDKVVEVTFGAKMINRDYHKKLKGAKNLVISSACPGIVESIKNSKDKEVKKFSKNLISVDSPMEAMGKICKKNYGCCNVFFISPCHFKKTEASKSKNVDYVIDYLQLHDLFKKNGIKGKRFRSFIERGELLFDKFYNDYTKIYPLSGGLSKTAHLKGVLSCEEVKILDGWAEVVNFLKRPEEGVRFLDCTFCGGGCIGGPCTNQKMSLREKHKRIMKYMKKAEKQDIPEDRKGLIKCAKGLKFSK